MPKGYCTNERIEYTDAVTGAHIIQLTSYPSPSMTLFYGNVNFTSDSERLILLCQRSAARNVPWDLWCVRTDGSELRQLTDRDGCGGFVLHPNGQYVFFHRAGALWRLGLDTLEEAFVHDLGARGSVGLGFITPDGEYYFTASHTPGNGPAFRAGAYRAAPSYFTASNTPVKSARSSDRSRWMTFRVKTDGTEIMRGEDFGTDPWTIHSVSPGGHGVLAIATTETGKEYRLLDYYLGTREVYTRTHDFAHSTFLGCTKEIQGCGFPPARGLFRIAPGEETPRTIATGPYFWHSAASLDGEWIVADTNWPDMGLQLVHVPTGHFAPLCYPRASQGHPQWSHPHPQFSPDGRCVAFTSDATGIPQVYLVRISDELREMVMSGGLSVKTRRR